jgi:hypothetical protein
VHLTVLDKVLWVAGFVGHVTLFVVLVIRGRVRLFPVFTCLIAYEALLSVALFSVSRYTNPHAYRTVYWILAPVDYSFQIALILEIARNVVRPIGTLASNARLTFLRWAIAGVTLAAGLSIRVAPPELSGLNLWAARATIFTSLLTCVTFLAMIAWTNRLGMPWAGHVMALGQGLTVWALVALSANVVNYASRWRKHRAAVDHAGMITYLAVLAFWSVAFWKPDRRWGAISPAAVARFFIPREQFQRDGEPGEAGKDAGT